ncbi:MAG: ABC transporter substrate-binding protein [Clostridia bacterium]|nr:ABC transporter substrate-binding protein [Clostridia bacterium]
MKLKRILAAVLSCALIATSLMAVTGCNGETGTTDPENKTYTVGICQLVQHPALDAATEGFKKALTEKLGDKVKFDEQNAAGEPANCTTIVNQFVASNVDLIMANATPALQAAASATADIPVLATSITEYGVALGIDNFSGKTGINVSGTSDLAPLDKQAAMFAELLPEAKKVGIIYCSNEANSKYQVTVVKAELEKAGIEVTEYSFADSNDIAQVVTKACDEVDAFYIPTDNQCANNAELINSIAEPAKKPIIAGEEGICKGCGIATLSISYSTIGYNTGLMAYEILVNGKNPGEMDIQYDDAPVYKYAPARCEALGITVPETYEAIAD